MIADKQMLQLMSRAYRASRQSTCLSRQVGCVIAQNGIMVSVGINDTKADVRKCGAGGCERCVLRSRGLLVPGERRDACKCLHAEQVALMRLPAQASRGNLVIYITIPPCVPCANLIYDYGIRTVVFPEPPHEGQGIKRLHELKVTVISLQY
jgi:dCMP deaminase